MSLLTMTDIAVSRQIDDAQSRVEPTSSKKRPASTKVLAVIDRLTAFIPTEVISIYVLGLGISPPAQPSWRWVMFFLAVALVPVFVIFGLLERNRGRRISSTKVRRTAVVLVAMGISAFVAWAAAMPDTPFDKLFTCARQIGVLGATVLAFLLPPLARLLRVA